MTKKRAGVPRLPHLLGIEGLSPETISGLLDLSENYVDQNRSIDKRRDLLSQVQKRIADQAVELPLYNTSKIDAVPATLENFKGNPTNAGPFWNVHEWSVSPAAARTP